MVAVTFGIVRKYREGDDKKVEIVPPPKLVQVTVTTDPIDALLRVDGALYSERTIGLGNIKAHPVTVSHIGYKTLQVDKWTSESWQFKLIPEPLYISVSTNAESGEVFYDGQKLGNLAEGIWEDSSIVPDGGRHILSATSKNQELFRVAFRAIAGLRPAVEPLTLPSLTVGSSLQNLATVYSGSSTSLSVPGQPARQADKKGTDLNLETVDENSAGSDVEVRLGKGERGTALAIKRGNAPALNIVSTAGDALPPNVVITTLTKRAVLFLDGKKMAAKRQGAWELRVPPGPHSLKLTADGMRDEERQIAVDVKHNLKQTITMTTAQRFATMVIKDGTPGAQVLIDQQFVGALDANGSLTYSKVPAGHHDISFEKVGYSSLSTRQLFFENRTLPVPGNLRLSEATGHVTISISPSTAKVEYRQAGTANWQTIPSRVISLPPGNYDFAATAPQFQRAQRSVAVKVSETSPLNFALQPETPPPPTANSLISGSASLVSSNGWFISKTGAWIAVPSGTMECTIIFLRPDRYPAGDRPPKHLQWVIATDQDTISYALDSHGLSRKATTAGGPKKIPANFPSDLNYDVRLTVSQNTIQLKSKDGLLLDELKTDAENWTHVEVRVKGDAYFDVRR